MRPESRLRVNLLLNRLRESKDLLTSALRNSCKVAFIIVHSGQKIKGKP